MAYTIHIPPIFLASRGLVVLCEGKKTAQPSDGLYYTVLQSVKAYGIDLEPIYVKGGLTGTDSEGMDVNYEETSSPNDIRGPPALEASIALFEQMDELRGYLKRSDHAGLSALILSRDVDHPLRGAAVLKLLIDRSAAIARADAARNARVLAARQRINASMASGSTDVFDPPESPAADHLRALRRHIFRLSSQMPTAGIPIRHDPLLSHPEAIWLATECIRAGSMDPLITCMRRGVLPTTPEVGWVLFRGGQLECAGLVLGRADCIDLTLNCLVESGNYAHAIRFVGNIDGEEGSGVAVELLRGVVEDMERMRRGERRGWAVGWDGSGADRVRLGELSFLAMAENEWPMRPSRTPGAAWIMGAAVVRWFPQVKVAAITAVPMPEPTNTYLNQLPDRDSAFVMRLVGEFLDGSLQLEMAIERAREIHNSGGGLAEIITPGGPDDQDDEEFQDAEDGVLDGMDEMEDEGDGIVTDSEMESDSEAYGE
jgi:hypothetical protein